MHYNSYHTSIKHLARQYKLPEKYLRNIDRSTIWRWKNELEDKYIGSEFSNIEDLNKFLERKESDTEGEASKINEMLTDSEFKYWPINSIAYYALRNNLVNASLATWYNYAKNLGIHRRRFPKKPKYGEGIRASAPHQIWHADITVVKCLNGMKYYVYLLMDNFSRYILNWQISDKVSAKIRMESIRQAYDQYIKGTDLDVKLIVDGGVENNNGEVDALLNSEGVSIRKLIAGKDIRFSNSLFEDQNKIIKHHYLLKQSYSSGEDLKKLLEWNINDYQHKRPHHSLKGLIPIEALNGISVPKEQWIQQIEKAKQVRLQENASKPCEICAK